MEDNVDERIKQLELYNLLFALVSTGFFYFLKVLFSFVFVYGINRRYFTAFFPIGMTGSQWKLKNYDKFCCISRLI